MCWLSLQEHTASNLPNKFTIASLYLPPHRHHAWPPTSLPALVRVVIDVGEAALFGERAAIARIIDHEVGVAAELDRAFPRVEPEDFRGLGRAGIHHGLESQPVRGDAKGMDQVHPFLHRRDAVGDLRECL